MSKGSLRDKMPEVTAWIDNLREGFGKEFIDGIIRAGINGKPVFFASENGNTIGTPVRRGVRVGTDERGNRYLIDGPQASDPKESKTKFKPSGSNDYLDWGK